jgi:hypothetical protein
MQLGFLLLTDHSESLNGKLYAMGAGWNTLRFAQLPVEMSFGIGLGIDVEWNETNQRHALEVEIIDPDGQRLAEPFRFELETGRPPGMLVGQDQRIVLSLVPRCRFEHEGPHRVRVAVAGSEIGGSRFYVARVQPPGMAGAGAPPAPGE